MDYTGLNRILGLSLKKRSWGWVSMTLWMGNKVIRSTAARGGPALAFLWVNEAPYLSPTGSLHPALLSPMSPTFVASSRVR